MRYIIHLSDIHIRKGDIKSSRYAEYNTVFDNLFISIKNKINGMHQNDFIIVVTGDIFHDKNLIGNYGLMLYKKLIKGLTSIGKVIIFHGNHDRNQSEVEQPSLISSTIEIDNLILLQHTKSFIIDNVGFSYVSIDDTLDTYVNSGRINDLPAFPVITHDENVKHTVALFHGTFANVKINHSQYATVEHKPYPFEWIQDFDYAILGDIHLRQKGVFKGRTLWGYAGSLIQQNFGEEIIEHGYMIWDLDSRIIHDVNVYNNCGMINMKQTDNEIVIRQGMQYNMHLCALLCNPLCPKKMEIKVYSDINTQKLHDMLCVHNIEYRLITYKQHHNNTKHQESSHEYDIYIDKHVILKYFADILSQEHYHMLHDIMRNYDALLFNKDVYPIDLYDECMKKNKELSTLIANCIQSDENILGRAKFTIAYLEWDNIYCYEANNFIHFDEALYNTLLIAGSNGTGKSAIYDIITLAIWGDITKYKQNSLTSGIVNSKYTKGHTTIILNMDNKIYKICREFHVAKDKNVLQRPTVSLYQDNVLLKRNSASNDEIEKLFGTLDEFLATSMITQNMDYDILDLSWKDCVCTIDKATNIHFVNDLYTLLKGCSNKYKDFMKTIESKKQVYASIIASSIQTEDIDISILYSKKQHLIDENNSIAVDINNPIVIKVLNSEDDNTYEENESELQSLYDTLNDLKTAFKDYTDEQINELYLQYNDSILSCNKDECILKPCEYSAILEEEQLLQGLHVTEYDKHILQNKIQELNIMNETQIIVPMHIPLYQGTEIDFMTEICNIFGNIQSLHEFCNNNPLQNINKSDDAVDMNLNTYIEYKHEYDKLQNSIMNYEKELAECRAIFDELYIQQRTKEYITEPTDISYMSYDDAMSYNLRYDDILYCMNQDEEILTYLYNELDKIKVLEADLIACKNELSVFENNDEYAYNPKCHYCCKRPWVYKLKELQTQNISLQKKIQHAYSELFDKCTHDYLQTYIRHEKHKCIIAWFDYYTYQDTCNHVNSLLIQKNSLQQVIDNDTTRISIIKCYMHNFCNKAHQLYQNYLYHAYNKWKQLNDEIFELQKKIVYLPRIQKLQHLKCAYEQWSIYNKKRDIIKAYKLYEAKAKITAYEKTKEYNSYKRIKPLIIRKIELIKMINDIDVDINEAVRNQTIAKYNKSNKLNYDMLCNSLDNINKTLTMLDTVVDKFKQYRKDLYDKFVLRNLVIKANNYIKTLCHSDTKIFEVNYLITEHKDSIHINWLIQNIGDVKQIISVCQASGFQRFVISLALRMSLYANKRCEQIFIDEGFTSCDKKNLSKVPEFLKGLLYEYKGVIIMSHIDIIEENIEKKAHIKYNKATKASLMQY